MYIWEESKIISFFLIVFLEGMRVDMYWEGYDTMIIHTVTLVVH
jgi:hypothetical protein